MSAAQSPHPSLRAVGYAVSELGNVRLTNEDAFFLCDRSQVYAVADGMGGLPYGEKASECAVRALGNRREAFIEQKIALPVLLSEVNRAVWQLGRILSPRLGIGTTMTLLANRGTHCEIAHVGDSAAYWLRESDLHCLTLSQVRQIPFEGQGAPAPGETLVYRTELSKYLGQLEGICPSHFCFSPSVGDRVLLCSDGLTTRLELDELQQVCHVHQERERLANALLKIAAMRGGVDNATMIVVDFEAAATDVEDGRTTCDDRDK